MAVQWMCSRWGPRKTDNISIQHSVIFQCDPYFAYWKKYGRSPMEYCRRSSHQPVPHLHNGFTTTSTDTPEIDKLPVRSQFMQILHMHHNVPGVLSKIRTIFSEFEVSVISQHLQPDSKQSYIALELWSFMQNWLCENWVRLEKALSSGHYCQYVEAIRDGNDVMVVLYIRGKGCVDFSIK